MFELTHDVEGNSGVESQKVEHGVTSCIVIDPDMVFL